MTTIAVIQSNYLPWKGYFDLIHDVEAFIFYDDVQYTTEDWRNRNRLKGHQGPFWLTVPVQAGTPRKRICEVGFADGRWAEKHWKTIQQYYGRAPHFGRYRDFFEHVYMERSWEGLSELNQFLITRIARDLLGITTEFRDSRAYAAEGEQVDRLLDLLSKAGASRYVSGPSARSYIDPARFEAAGIELLYKSYAGYPEYPQFHPPFAHDVSILDLLFHMGPEAAAMIWGWREATRRIPQAEPATRLVP